MRMDVFKIPAKPADRRIHYRLLKSQFGALQVPSMVNAKLAPLIAFLHG